MSNFTQFVRRRRLGNLYDLVAEHGDDLLQKLKVNHFHFAMDPVVFTSVKYFTWQSLVADESKLLLSARAVFQLRSTSRFKLEKPEVHNLGQRYFATVPCSQGFFGWLQSG